MADLRVERKKGRGALPWILGAILFAALAWAISRKLGDDARDTTGPAGTDTTRAMAAPAPPALAA